MGARGVVLLSGGLDSGVALGLWLAAGHEVEVCLTAEYGQRAAAMEVQAARALAARLGAAWEALPLPFLADAMGRSGSALGAGGADLPRGTAEQPGDAASAAAVWVPARNVVLLAAAAAIAEARGADAVVIGFNREEAATFPDNSAAFLERSTSLLELGTRTGVRVESPTLDMDKVELGAAAGELGLPPTAFWSCYDAGPEPCGHCESCRRLARAFPGGT